MLALYLAAMLVPASVDGCGRGEREVIPKVKVLYLTPKCLLNPISSVLCSFVKIQCHDV